MADTVVVDIVDSDWTEVAAAGGFLTNETGQKLVYREAATKPDDALTSGHTLENRVGSFIQFTLATNQKIFARSVGGDGRIAFTPED